MTRELEVFGRRLLAERDAAGWHLFEPGADGKRRPAPGLLVPGFVTTDAELLAYLADLLHEHATPERSEVRWRS
jgi:hypothetical protein